MTIEQAYKAWQDGEISNSEFLKHLIRHHNLAQDQMFMDLWWEILKTEPNPGEA